MIWYAVIRGAPRTKKTHSQIIRAGGRPRLIPSHAFLAWNKNYAQPQLAAAKGKPDNAGTKLPIYQAVNCRALFYRQTNVGDAVGYYQALADALEDAGVVFDDKMVVSWDGSRMLKDAINPRIELWLEAAKW